MAKRWFVETTPEGRQQFVSIKRSRSYGGRHDRVREIDYVKVSLDEWNALVDKERKLEEINKSVVDDCNRLKSTASTSQAEAKRLAVVVIPGLEKQIGVLTIENEALRRSVDKTGDHSSKHHREEERLRYKIVKLEADNLELREQNAGLREKNRSLSLQIDKSFSRRVSELVGDVEFWKHQYKHWRSRYEELLKRYNDIFDLLETRTRKMKAYEDILRRNDMI
ncbi:intermediate filament domain-containing [Trichoderma arundinaceum]|uniref:Intermediate filament domain-containing n=1 Tax=Trichoderma arundinaceum TaxID=490622 RepID=A0A395NNX7_TRIAR|nr:intermediate filament domain-containing [Trichoderma arundinaceum]